MTLKIKTKISVESYYFGTLSELLLIRVFYANFWSSCFV